MNPFQSHTAFVLAATALMVAVAYGVGCGVYLLPVFPVLAYGCWGERPLWKCSKMAFVAVLSLAAAIGVALVNVNFEGLLLNSFVVFVLVAALLVVTRTNLYPAFAVAQLPVFMFDTRWIYVLTVFALSLVVVGVNALLALKGCSVWKRVAVTEPLKRRFGDFAIQIVALLPLLLAVRVVKNPCMLLPFIVYVYFEVCNNDEWRSLGLLPVLQQTLWAVLLGAVADGFVMAVLPLLGVEWCGVVPAIAYSLAACALLASFFFLYGQRLFAPVLSVCLFPFLRDAEIGYVVAADCSLVYLALASVAVVRFSTAMCRKYLD